ncbi:unnamed protein product [Prunus brigantina]
MAESGNEFNGNAGVILAIQDMASAIRENSNQDHRHETEEDRVMRIQGQFRKTKPTIFKGEPNPMAAEEWLRQIKRKMDNQRIPEDIRVVIACTYLEGQAYLWWESILSMPDIEITTWEAFEKLMHFAPYMIPDDATKAKRFEEGLRPSILEKVDILKLRNQSPQHPGGQSSQIRPRVPAAGKKSGPFTQGRTIEGMFLVFNSWAKVLFDCGATHSFISTSFASMLELDSENMKPSLLIGSPLGGSLEVDKEWIGLHITKLQLTVVKRELPSILIRKKPLVSL